MNGTFFLIFFTLTMELKELQLFFKVFMRQKGALQMLDAFAKAGFNMNCSNT